MAEIKASKSLHPVVWAGSGITSSERRKDIDLPTWVPDFESRNPDYTQGRLQFRAGGSTIDEHVAVSNDHRALTIDGTLCDLEGNPINVLKQMYGDTLPLMTDEVLNDTEGDWLSKAMFRTGIYAIKLETPTFFFTKGGFMGFGSEGMQDGDEVLIPFGSSAPLLVRPHYDSGAYTVVGYCYIYGVMAEFDQSI